MAIEGTEQKGMFQYHIGRVKHNLKLNVKVLLHFGKSFQESTKEE